MGSERLSRSQTTPSSEENPWPSAIRGWWVTFVLTLCFACAYIDRQIISLLVEPIQRDLQISDTQFSFLLGLTFALFYALVGIPLGRLADRWNRRNIIAWSVFAWCLATAACGMANSYWMLFLARVGVGAGEGGLPSSAGSILSDYFPPEKLTLPFGIFVSGHFIGGGLAFIVGGQIIDIASAAENLSLPIIGDVRPWQMIFFAVGLPGLLLLPLLMTVKEPVRRGIRNLSEDQKAIPLPELFAYLRARWKAYLPFLLGTPLFAAYNVGLVGWSAAYFMRTFGWSPAEFGLRFGLIYFCAGMAGTIVAGWIDRRAAAAQIWDAKVRLCFAIAVIIIPLGWFATTVSDPWLSAALITAVIFFASMPQAVTPSALHVISPNEMRGVVLAIYLLVLSIFGLGGGPTFVALVTDFVFKDPLMVGWSLASIAVVMGVLAAVCYWFGRKDYQRVALEAQAWQQQSGPAH